MSLKVHTILICVPSSIVISVVNALSNAIITLESKDMCLLAIEKLIPMEKLSIDVDIDNNKIDIILRSVRYS